MVIASIRRDGLAHSNHERSCCLALAFFVAKDFVRPWAVIFFKNHDKATEELRHSY